MDWVEAVRARILTALAKAYLNEYAGYKLWADAVPVLIREDETNAGEAAKRMANNCSHRLDGFKAAAEALGLPVVLIERPAIEYAAVAGTFAEVLEFVGGL